MYFKCDAEFTGHISEKLNELQRAIELYRDKTRAFDSADNLFFPHKLSFYGYITETNTERFTLILVIGRRRRKLLLVRLLYRSKITRVHFLYFLIKGKSKNVRQINLIKNTFFITVHQDIYQT